MKSKKNKNITVFPGSFNPVHPGHLTTIYQTTHVFDKVIVLVASNPDKNYSVPAKTRMTWIKNFFKDTTCEKKFPMMSLTRDLPNIANPKALPRSFAVFVTRPTWISKNHSVNIIMCSRKKIGFELNYIYFAADKHTKHLSSTAVKQFLKFADIKQFSDLFFNACWTTGTELRQNTLKEILDAYHG